MWNWSTSCSWFHFRLFWGIRAARLSDNIGATWFPGKTTLFWNQVQLRFSPKLPSSQWHVLKLWSLLCISFVNIRRRIFFKKIKHYQLSINWRRSPTPAGHNLVIVGWVIISLEVKPWITTELSLKQRLEFKWRKRRMATSKLKFFSTSKYLRDFVKYQIKGAKFVDDC